MARSIWKGNITFGLVTVPIQLFSAVREKKIGFHLLTPDGDCRLRQKLYCPETGKEYDFSETARGYEIAPDQYVIIEKEELAAVKPEAGRTIDIMDFVDLEQIDPVYYSRPYYALPDQRSTKPYSLLVDAMQSSGRIAIARFVMREHEYLAAIRVYKDILCIETMHFHDEVVSVDELDYEAPKKEVSARERKLAEQLIDTLYSDFKPEKYRDEYRERVLEMIEAKAAGKKIVVPDEKPSQPTKVVDLLEVLKRSVNERKRGNGRAERERPRRERAVAKRAPRPAKKQSAKAKKTKVRKRA